MTCLKLVTNQVTIKDQFGQLWTIKGEKGDPGEKGEKGDNELTAELYEKLLKKEDIPTNLATESEEGLLEDLLYNMLENIGEDASITLTEDDLEDIVIPKKSIHDKLTTLMLCVGIDGDDKSLHYKIMLLTNQVERLTAALNLITRTARVSEAIYDNLTTRVITCSNNDQCKLVVKIQGVFNTDYKLSLIKCSILPTDASDYVQFRNNETWEQGVLLNNVPLTFNTDYTVSDITDTTFTINLTNPIKVIGSTELNFKLYAWEASTNTNAWARDDNAQYTYTILPL